ncbi:MAG: LOG family protein, partial [Bacteroidaceae bacterium]|nr:LOG family protein [Bacteroidaceae bacterium]
DEVFHVVAAATIGYHSKRVVLYNIDGFWDGLLAVLNQMEAQGFIRRPLDNFLNVANTFDELKELLK